LPSAFCSALRAAGFAESVKQTVKFTQELEEEEKRAVTENLSEEELTLFDILTKPEMELTKKERNQVKKAARALLETLKQEKLVLDWRKRQQSRAAVKVTIEQILDQELPLA
jgi:type I restriction enzyme R subunit